MAQLDKAPGGMTLGELSQRMMVSNGNVTGLSERLMALGLLDRRQSRSDRRAQLVSLTAEGRRVFRAMARAHEGWIAEIFSESDVRRHRRVDAASRQNEGVGAPCDFRRIGKMTSANPGRTAQRDRGRAGVATWHTCLRSLQSRGRRKDDAAMIRSAHIDTFARDHLPSPDLLPDFLFTLPELHYPDRLNCVTAFVDDWLAAGHGDRDCLISPAERLSYAGLAERVNRIANVLVRDLGVVPGNRVLLRGPNSPMMVAAYFAVIKAGAVVVATMPLLRAKEIAFPVTKAEIRLALCDVRLADEMEKTRPLAPTLERVVYWGAGAGDSLEALMMKPGYEHFDACDTASDDVCLIAFTSGTTGVPKGTMHFHRDMLAICDTFGKYVLRAGRDDRFIGSPPIAFTFGLGGLVLFPLRVGAAAILLEKAAPDDLLAGDRQISRHDLLHRADRLPLHARQARGTRPLVAAKMRLGGGDVARRHVRRLACGDRHPDHRRHRVDRDAAHFHRFAGRGDAGGRDRKAGARIRSARHR